ncbi:MAG: hypothetical protein WCX32_02115 [Clostridia bacterium]|jgi:hypothetical protein|nr:hypothetical protein [Clostridia bacterium]
MGLIQINDDVLDIASRIKEIDECYYIMFNTTKRRFEVHNSGQGNNTLATVIPYDTLDARTICYLRTTRRERAKELTKEIELTNERLQQNALSYATAEAEIKLKDYLKYADDKHENVDFSALN